MNKITIIRKEETDQATMGEIYVGDQQVGHTLEQPWNNNKEGNSCIPPGRYTAYIRDSSSSRWGYNPIQLVDVFNREYIQIHIGNYPKDTRGCILPGKSASEDAVWNSGDAYKEIMEKIDQTKEIEVIIKYDN